MRLRDLDATFLKITEPGHSRIGNLSESDGICFQCPLCAAKCEPGEEDGRKFFRGAHYIICWWSKVPLNTAIYSGPGRWNPQGTSIDDLTFVGPGAVSVLLQDGCGWHGFVRSGDAT